MSENTHPESPASSKAPAAAVPGEAPAPAKKARRKAPRRLRDMQSAGQNGGWMWIEKDAVDRILLKTAGVEPGLIFSTYAALCRIASDRANASSVTAGTSLIAKLAGCSRRTVLRALAELERVKLVAVRRVRVGKINDENTYFLLACGSRGATGALVTKSHLPSDCESLGVVSENGHFSGTVLKERDSLKSPLSREVKTPMALAAALGAQQARRFTNKDGHQVHGLGGW